MNSTTLKNQAYERFGIIGQGSVTTLYEGFDHELKRDVVIKELRPEFRNHAETAEKFWGEATLLAGLNHANILRVYGVDRERFWIALEPLQALRASYGEPGKMPAERVREILKHVLEGLRYLHSLDRCHGQLSLSVLLVDSQGTIKLNNLAENGNDGEFRCPDASFLHCAPEILNPSILANLALSQTCIWLAFWLYSC